MSDLRDKFYKDPDWSVVEAQILAHIEPLKDMATLDVSQPAEHVKAEVIGRMLAFNSLARFLQESGLVTREIKPFANPFR